MRAIGFALLLSLGLLALWQISEIGGAPSPMGEVEDVSEVNPVGSELPSIGEDDGEKGLIVQRMSALPVVSVQIRVLDDGLLPIAKVFVGGEERAVTNEKGVAELESVIEGQEIEVRASGFFDAKERLHPKQSVIEVLLIRGVSISGVVYDSVSGAGVSDVLIRSDWEDSSVVRTDDQGRFGPLMLPAGMATDLFVEKMGYTPRSLSMDGVGDNQVLVALHQGEAIKGVVLGRKKEPLSGAVIVTPGGNRERSDESGAFSVLASFKSGGNIPITVSAQGYAAVSLFVRPNSDPMSNSEAWGREGMKVTLVPSASVRGSATLPNGSALESGEIVVLRDGASVLESGNAYFRSLPSRATWAVPNSMAWPVRDGKFHISSVLPWMGHTTLEVVDSSSGNRFSKTIHQSIEPGGVFDLQWDLIQDASNERSAELVQLSGLVTVNGIPMKRGFVEWQNVITGGFGSCMVSNGKYSGPVPSGDVKLRVYVLDENKSDISTSVLHEGHLRDVYISPGAAQVENFSLELELGVISGRVEKMPLLEAVANAPVFVGSGRFTWSGSTNQLGEFRLNAPPGLVYDVGVQVGSQVILERGVKCGQYVDFLVGAPEEIRVIAKNTVGEPVGCSSWWRPKGGSWWRSLGGNEGKGPVESEAVGEVSNGAIELCVVPNSDALSEKFAEVDTNKLVGGVVEVVLESGLTLELSSRGEPGGSGRMFLLRESEWDALQELQRDRGDDSQASWTMSQEVIPYRLLERREIHVGEGGNGAIGGLAQGTFRLMTSSKFTAMEPMVDVVGPGVTRVITW